jgi:hypothetical protein
MNQTTQAVTAAINSRAIANMANAPEVKLADTATWVDRLAYLKGHIASLKEEENNLKAMLKEAGGSVFESTFYRCTVSDMPGKSTVDWQAIAMKYNPSRQLIRANTSTGAGFTMVRIVAKKTS